MSFPLRIPGPLKQHLRALRKSRGFTQAQLGALVGVKQARIAEIEANPGAVSLGQLITVLAALGGTLHLHSAQAAPARTPPKTAPVRAARALARKPAVRRKATGAAELAPRTGVVIRPKKGAW